MSGFPRHMAKLMDLTAPVLAVESEDGIRAPSYQDRVKLLIWALCRLLSPVNRERLIEALQNWDTASLKKTAAETEQAEEDMCIAKMIAGWQSVLGADLTKEQRDFALSIMKKRGKETWWPSKAQIGRMKQIWRESHRDE